MSEWVVVRFMGAGLGHRQEGQVLGAPLGEQAAGEGAHPSGPPPELEGVGCPCVQMQWRLTRLPVLCLICLTFCCKNARFQ